MVTSIDRYDEVDVFVGLDVGKDEHHAVVLDRTGKRLFDKPRPNDEAKLRTVLEQFKTHGTSLLVVDQAPNDRTPASRGRAGGGMRTSVADQQTTGQRYWIDDAWLDNAIETLNEKIVEVSAKRRPLVMRESTTDRDA